MLRLAPLPSGSFSCFEPLTGLPEAGLPRKAQFWFWCLEINEVEMASRRHRVLLLTIGAALMVAAWYWFRPEKLFTNKRVNEPAPFATNQSAQPLFTGVFSRKLHDTRGRATIYRDSGGSLSLRLTGFRTSEGPDVHVVLASSSDPALASTSPGRPLQLFEVGALRGNEGDQTYIFAPQPDLKHFDTVVIYCERFRAVFGTAKIEEF